MRMIVLWRLMLGVGVGLAVVGWGGSAVRGAETLNVFIWSEYIDPEVVKEFERDAGAKVVIDLYEDSESMLAKVQAAPGQYDIVVPPEHLVPVMLKLKLLTPLRRERLPNFRHLDPKLLGLPSDPTNGYTVPYQWGTVGIFYRKTPGKPAPDSWAAFFDPSSSSGRFVLLDSMRDTIGAALKFRGYSLNATNAASLKAAREVLAAAKPRTLAFEGSVGARNRVLAKAAALAMVYSGEAARGMAEDPETGYVIPKEGSEIWVDNLAIPTRAPHRDLAERFINYLLDPRVAARISNFTQFATPNVAAREWIRPEDLKNPAIYPPAELLPKLEFLQDLGASSRLYDQVWTQVKSR